MTTNEIAKILFDMYGMTWKEAMQIASDMVFHQGAYHKEKEQVLNEVYKIGSDYIIKRHDEESTPISTSEPPAPVSSDDEDIYIDDGEEDDDEELISEWEDLRDFIESVYDGDNYYVERSIDLINDILDQAAEEYGKAEGMRMLNDGWPGLKDEVKSLMLAVYSGSGYSKKEGGKEKYKEKIERLEGIFGLKSSLKKWWE